MAEPNIQTHSKELKEFVDLIKTKSDLPQNIETLLLLRFLNVCGGDAVAAEKMLRKNLKFRKKCPKLFNNRDVLSDAFQGAQKVAQVFPMPKATPDGYEIVVFRLKDTNPRHFITKDILRSNVTMLDAKFLTDADTVKGAIGLIDLTGFTFKHFLKAFSNFSMQNSYGKFVHQAAPWKPIRIHAVHCPAILKRFLSFVGPRVRRNYMELLRFHDNYEIDDEALTKEFLPNEFGGTAGSIDDLHNDWLKVLHSKRNFNRHNHFPFNIWPVQKLEAGKQDSELLQILICHEICNGTLSRKPKRLEKKEKFEKFIHRDYILNGDNWKLGEINNETC